MKRENLDEIIQLANVFRQAIEYYIHSCTPKTQLLQVFPRGNCQLASGFLQKFLYENGIDTVLICGIDYGEENESHAWLVTDDEIVIDITGDQYKTRPNEFNYDIPVYVGPMDSFHKLFSINYREPYKEPDFDPLVSPLVKNNNTDYDEIKEIALKKLR